MRLKVCHISKHHKIHLDGEIYYINNDSRCGILENFNILTKVTRNYPYTVTVTKQLVPNNLQDQVKFEHKNSETSLYFMIVKQLVQFHFYGNLALSFHFTLIQHFFPLRFCPCLLSTLLIHKLCADFFIWSIHKSYMHHPGFHNRFNWS